MGRHTNAYGQQGQADRRRNGVHVIILVAVLAGAGATVFTVAGLAPSKGGTTAAPAPNTSRTAPVGDGHTLVIAVTGKRCHVDVRSADGNVLLRGTLPHGKTVHFTDPQLDVRLSDSSAAQVYVNGTLRPAGRAGEPTSFTAARP